MSHACPICGVSLDPVPRYPRYVCGDCASKAVATDGRQLQFSNVGFSGGFEACYADTDEAYASHACWIDSIPCYVDEAHFDGIVIEATPTARGTEHLRMASDNRSYNDQLLSRYLGTKWNKEHTR